MTRRARTTKTAWCCRRLIVGGTTTATVTLSNAVLRETRCLGRFQFERRVRPSIRAGLQQSCSSAGVNTLTFPVPLTAMPGGSYARFRVSPDGGLTPVGYGGLGEVEDYRVGIQKAAELDYGDAPNSYSTLLGSNGPRHTIAGPRLGTLIDAEANGAPSVGATGDDTVGRGRRGRRGDVGPDGRRYGHRRRDAQQRRLGATRRLGRLQPERRVRPSGRAGLQQRAARRGRQPVDVPGAGDRDAGRLVRADSA